MTEYEKAVERTELAMFELGVDAGFNEHAFCIGRDQGDTEIKLWSVYTPLAGGGKRRITTVMGRTELEAQDRAWDTLNRPGRVAIALEWRDMGCRVEPKE